MLHKHFRTAVAAAALAAALTPAAHAATEQNQASSAILFQGFHWDSANGSWYANLQSKAADLKDLGVTHVWFPPPSDAASTQGYLPRQLNILDSSYGTEAALTSAISALSAQGISSVADVVINHRVGTTNWADFTNPTWDCRAVVSNDEWSGHCGNADTGLGYAAARDIDHTQTFVQNDLKTWIGTRLTGVGFTGIRYDFALGYGASYAGLYHDAMNPNFCVGEVWTTLDYNNVDAHRQLLMNYVDGNGGKCGAFDFTTKGLLNDALANNNYYRLQDSTGKPAGGIGWWAQKMVTFVDNHDTGPSETCSAGQNLWPVPCDKVMQGYAYILTHPGIPTIYYPHVYDWGLRANIKALVDARKAAGITSTSAVSIQQAVSGLYAAIITGTNYQLAMKIGPNSWTPSGNWTLVASGTNYAVWKAGSTGGTCTTNVTFTIANANTSYGENLYVVGNQTALGSWAPASAAALTIQGSGANVPWTGTVSLPCSTAVQYKYIKRNPSTGSVVWESNQSTSSGNREITTSATSGATTAINDGSFKF
jgi:alpha-amylase